MPTSAELSERVCLTAETAPHGSPEVSIWRCCMSEGANDRFEGQKIGKWMTVWWTDGIDNNIITEHQATFATSERVLFFNVSGRCLFIRLFCFVLFCFTERRYLAETFSPIPQSEGNQEQPWGHGWLASALLCNSWMVESLYPHCIITPSAWQWTSSDGSMRLIIGIVAPQALCVWLLLPWSLIFVWLLLLFGFPVIAASHKDQFIIFLFLCFWQGFAMEPYLRMCKHLCLEVCRGCDYW